jgi:two-component system, NarL family, nitrate/nitrite response regulator NarL
VRLLIVDDQDYIRRGLRAILVEMPEVEICGEAVNGAEAFHMAAKLRPDVVLMDISLPILDGLEATRMIRRLLPAVQVITISQYELEDPREVLQAGAYTHVPKLTVWNKLLPALRTLRLSRP